ncbi:MAG: sigma-70 family RNA polymerase sigma factor [Actinomycetota bacterium]|nr:sigma-70 family RNA polymerase sigma factor [Actinomycetota bacterium]
MHDQPTASMPPDAKPSPHVVDDERRLVRRAQSGDEQAFEALVQRYGQPILALAYASTLEAAAAEELAQDVFLAAWRGLGRFRRESAFSTWLFAIARNAAVDAARRRGGRLQTISLAEAHAVEARDTSSEASAVLEAAAGLAAPLREALLLREIQGLSYEEIAAIQNVPLGTVRSRISAARSFVADRLRP